jgi:hypothetical protein
MARPTFVPPTNSRTANGDRYIGTGYAPPTTTANSTQYANFLKPERFADPNIFHNQMPNLLFVASATSGVNTGGVTQGVIRSDTEPVVEVDRTNPVDQKRTLPLPYDRSVALRERQYHRWGARDLGVDAASGARSAKVLSHRLMHR